MPSVASLPPPAIAGCHILAYVVVPQALRFSAHTGIFVNGRELRSVPCLLIARPFHEPGVALFFCTRTWRIRAISLHFHVREARARAEACCPGLTRHWRTPLRHTPTRLRLLATVLARS